MKFLGVHKDPWHNTGACAIEVKNGKLEVIFISEERLDRVKDSRAFPIKSINACNDYFNINNVADYDGIILDYIENSDNWREDYKTEPCTIDNLLKDVDENKIHLINHHLCHAYATFMSSPFEEAAILVVDGRGSKGETQSLYVGKGNQITEVDKTDKVGIGLLYATMTQFIGFEKLQEGKTMGLAPYGNNYNDQKVDFQGKFSGIVTDYEAFCEIGSYQIKDKMLVKPSSFQQRAELAYKTQEECEKALLHLAKFAREETNQKYLCISGGVGLNSVANNAILKSNLFDDVFINPASSDTGIPLGAAMYGIYEIGKNSRIRGELSPYTGPNYSQQIIKSTIELFSGFDIEIDNTIPKAVELLKQNKIVARFEGRSEMGPRALGHRSILMSPMLAENKDTLNARVKYREHFRPFAPIVLAEHANSYFELDRPSKYMLFVPKVKCHKVHEIPAVTHIDQTARVQTVTKKFNGNLHTILNAFYSETNCPVLLNTSFNVAGEPIVETPKDAIKCFLSTNIDALFIENYLLIKNS